ncbi:MAG: DUF3365 domain-containing protein [Sulfurimonas sp.]|nr:DUF3365 domain-containing protein [Sulfurimonas sp.]MBU3939155.1 DUF3365 domain-containing protein [bacterium]MBU4024540.1 DUF3365 domain-containing protein [bacterium]MBU4058671.1 DUF3365 domain-containing protein [bacterium]
MKLLHSIMVFSLSTSILLAAPQAAEETELNQILVTGEASSKVLLETLGSRLKEQLETGGVMKAFEFCSDEAYNITQEVNKGFESGVNIKRISTQFRSPANAPKADESAVLEELSTLKKNGALPTHLVKQIDEKTFKYYKPLLIEKKVCLKCHGKIYKDNTDLKKAIEARYPLDSAINYEMGDLRGAIVVTITK